MTRSTPHFTSISFTSRSTTRPAVLLSGLLLGVCLLLSALPGVAAPTRTLSDPWHVLTLPITAGHRDVSASYRQRLLDEKRSGQTSGFYSTDGVLPLLRTVHRSNHDEKCEYFQYEFKDFDGARKATPERIGIAFAIRINRGFAAEQRNHLFQPDLGEFRSRVTEVEHGKIGDSPLYITLQEYSWTHAKQRTGNAWLRYSMYQRVPQRLRPSSKSRFFIIHSCITYGNAAQRQDFVNRVYKSTHGAKLHKVGKKQLTQIADIAAQGQRYTQAFGKWRLQCKTSQQRAGDCKLVQNFESEGLGGLSLKMSLSVDAITQGVHLKIQPFFDIEPKKKGSLQFGSQGTWNIGFVKCKRRRCIAEGKLSRTQVKAMLNSKRIGIQVPVRGDHERWFNTPSQGIREGMKKLLTLRP